MNNEEEKWKAVPDSHGNLWVSSFGNVKSVDRIVNRGHKGGIRLDYKYTGGVPKKSPTSHGYHTVSLGRGKWYLHRLVAQLFIPNPENKKTVNHINGIKTDNRVANLEWATQQENNLHCRRVLGKNRGSTHYVTTITEDDVLDIRTLKAFGGRLCDFARAYGLHTSTIQDIIKKRTWKHV